jgi:heme-degrading monooxygenase HmoA
MFIVISHHYCKPGQLEAARERMDKNASSMASEPGFIYRYRMERTTHPDVLSALTAWRDEEDFKRNRQNRFGSAHDLSATPYERIEHESYRVHATAARAPD